MTTTTVGTPGLVLADRLLAALCGRDFDRLADLLAPDVELRALLPRGHAEWAGVPDVAGRFRAWLGDPGEFEVLEAAIGSIAGRVQLRWRFRLTADRLGEGAFVIEQQAYVATAGAAITRIDLLCSGFRSLADR